MSVKTAEQVRTEFQQAGISIAEWAEANSLGTGLVYEVLAGRRKCIRGKSHRAAVLLGLKLGVLSDPHSFKPGAGVNKLDS